MGKKKREENKLHLLEMVSNSKLAFQEERRPTTLKLSFADNGFPVFNTRKGHTLLLHFIPVIQQFSIFRIWHNLLVGLYLFPNKAINKYLHWLVCVTPPPPPLPPKKTQQPWYSKSDNITHIPQDECKHKNVNVLIITLKPPGSTLIFQL